MGMDFSTTSADIDETPLPGENPVDYALRLAQEKAHACIRYAPFGAPLPPTTPLPGRETKPGLA